MLPSQSCHSLVCAFSSRSEWGDLEKKKKAAHCVGEGDAFSKIAVSSKEARVCDGGAINRL